jgi:hypothetical protein
MTVDADAYIPPRRGTTGRGLRAFRRGQAWGAIQIGVLHARYENLHPEHARRRTRRYATRWRIINRAALMCCSFRSRRCCLDRATVQAGRRRSSRPTSRTTMQRRRLDVAPTVSAVAEPFDDRLRGG